MSLLPGLARAATTEDPLSLAERRALISEQAEAATELKNECLAGVEDARGAPLSAALLATCESAIETYSNLRENLRIAIESEESPNPSTVQSVLGARLTTVVRSATIEIGVGKCAEAASRLEELLDDSNMASFNEIQNEARTELLRANTCLAPLPEPATRRSNAGPITLMAVGLGAVAGGAAWDIARQDQQDDYDTLRDRCSELCIRSDWERLAELDTSLTRSEVVVPVLYVSGATAFTAGLVWLLVNRRHDRRPEEAELSFVPAWGVGHVGGTLKLRW